MDSPIVLPPPEYGEVAELLGIDGKLKIAQNTIGSAGNMMLFNGISKGVVFLYFTNESSGHADSIVYITGPNSIRVQTVKSWDGAEYQKITMSNGILSISNSGYGIGNYIAVFIGA